MRASDPIDEVRRDNDGRVACDAASQSETDGGADGFVDAAVDAALINPSVALLAVAANSGSPQCGTAAIAVSVSLLDDDATGAACESHGLSAMISASSIP